MICHDLTISLKGVSGGMLKKIFVLFSIIVVIFSSFVTLGETSYASEVSDWEASFSEETDDELTQAAEKVSSYFSMDEDGNLTFAADRDTLVNELGVSEEDAHLMLLAVDELQPEQASKVQPYGFVGISINLGPKVRKMNGWAAGAFAAGYVGWYAKKFAVNPITAGVAGLITAGTAAAVKRAVEKNIRKVRLGRNIPGLSLTYNVNIP